MDFLKVQAQRIKEQLAGLTPSQRMLAGSLVVIMVMTLLWWSRYAASSEMVDVLGQDLSPEDLNRITLKIAERGIESKTVGSRVQVPIERQREVLAMLTFERLTPQDMSIGFDDVVQKMNSPWNTDKMQDAMLTRAKEATLMQIMREWPDVREARVMINSVIKRGFGDAAAAPSASVNLRMKRPGGKADKRLIAAAADTLAGVVSGLNRSKVSVVIDGAPYSVADHGSDAGAAGGGSDSFIEMVKEGERYYSEKIEARLARYGGAMVSVTVDPKMTSSQIEKETYDKSKTFLQPLSVDEKTEENVTSSGRAPAEPGVVPNTGANRPSDVSGGGGGGSEASNNNSTDTKTKNQIFPSVIRERLMNPAGTAAVVGASVSIPRSYLVRIFKAQSSSNKEPDEAALQPLVDSELRKVKNAVLGCVSQIPEDKILLDYYYDDLPMLEAAGQPAMASSVPLALTGHIKEIALGALAIISLFMVSMMVRKSSPAPIIAPKADRASVPLTVSAEDSATEVSEGIQSMDGMEVDEDSIRTQQMIGQVSNMVKENPDGAANLVKRWLNRA